MDTPSEPTNNLDLASRWDRLGGAIIDAVIVIIVVLPISFFMGVFDDLTQPQSLTTSLFLAVLGLAVYFAVNAKLLQNNAQTFGKKVMGTKIVRLDGSQPEFNELLIKRYVPYFGFQYFPYIGGLLNLVNVCFIFGKEKRCLHDKIAGTMVIKYED